MRELRDRKTLHIPQKSDVECEVESAKMHAVLMNIVFDSHLRWLRW